jgi:hypothetical protein
MADNTNNSSSSSSSNTNSNASSSSSSGRSRGRSNNTSNNNSNNNSNNIRIDIKQGLPESYPKINISAKMFVDRMDNYFQLQEALGNTLFRDNDTVKVMTFLNNVTDSAGTAIQLFHSGLRERGVIPATYATICREFIKSNTDVAEQDNLMRELIYELRPDTNTYKHEDAVRDYVNRFNEKLRRLEGSYDHQSMKNAIMQHIHPALRSHVQTLLVAQGRIGVITLSELQRLVIANANAVQDKWTQWRNNARDRQGTKRTYQQTRINHIESSFRDMNTHQSSNGDSSSINAISNQPRGIMDVVRAYCNAKNLCRWCKQERHLAANQRCNAVDRPVHIPDEELRAFASSRGYSLNFRGRQLK